MATNPLDPNATLAPAVYQPVSSTWNGSQYVPNNPPQIDPGQLNTTSPPLGATQSSAPLGNSNPPSIDQGAGMFAISPQNPVTPNISNFNQAYYQSPQYQSYLNLANQPMMMTDDFSPLPFGGMGSGTTAGLQQKSYDDFLKNLNMAQPPTSNPLTPTGTPTGTPTISTNPLSQYATPAPTTGYTPAPNLNVTPGGAGGSSFGQGSILPNVTSTQQQVTAAPSFYTDYLNQLASKGQQAASGSQYVGAQPLQEQAFNQVAQNVGNYQPTLQSAINLAGSVGQSNLAQAIGDVGQANIANYLAPQATAGLVGSGQFGSSRGARALGDTISNAELGITAQQAQAMQQDYANRLAAAQQLGSLAGQTQALGLGDINALSSLGGQQQTIKQNEQLFPMQQLTNESQLLRGYTIPTSVSASQTGPGQQGQFAMSPLQQIATIGTLAGALAQPSRDYIDPVTGKLVPGTSAGSNIISGLGNMLDKGLTYAGNLFNTPQPKAPVIDFSPETPVSNVPPELDPGAYNIP